jgi:hypothetical protein
MWRPYSDLIAKEFDFLALFRMDKLDQFSLVLGLLLIPVKGFDGSWKSVNEDESWDWRDVGVF